MPDETHNPWTTSLHERETQGLRRHLSTPPAGFLNLASNDYLCLSRHPQIIAAGKAALDQYGNSSTASPLICGYTEAHALLEKTIRAWYGFPSALIFNSGYTANQAVLSMLPQKEDVVLADKLIHNSMISGILGSQARLIRYPHLAIDRLEELLAQHASARRVWVVTESVFSMDGDYPDLKRIAALKKKYPFHWMVDEAHALGWYGKTGSGLCEAQGVLAEVDILLGTLGKALGGFGAYVLFKDPAWREYLINFSGEFIYSTYLPPLAAATGTCAIELVQKIPAQERNLFHERASSFREQLHQAGYAITSNESPIISFVVGDNQTVLSLAQKLKEKNILVGAIRPPTVPAGSARLRISLNRHLTQEDWQVFLHALMSN